jgi:hypothetical protein
MCIPPNTRRVGYIDSIHGPLDGPLYTVQHSPYCVRAAGLCHLSGLSTSVSANAAREIAQRKCVAGRDRTQDLGFDTKLERPT